MAVISVPILETILLKLLSTNVLSLSLAYIINDVSFAEKPKSFSGGSDSGKMTFWIGTHDSVYM